MTTLMAELLGLAEQPHRECDLQSDTRCVAVDYGDGNASEHATLRAAAEALKAEAPAPAPPPVVPLAALTWRDSSEKADRSRLLTTIQIGPVKLHLEAYLAEESDTSIQEFAGDFGDTADKVYDAIGADGAWETVVIEGREYVLIATPFCT
jgi:hypothetical protein